MSGDLPLFAWSTEREEPASGEPHSQRNGGAPRVLRVAELNRTVREALEHHFGDVWVEGELSDVTRAASGHIYFTLNDEKEPAQLRAVMFRGDARRARAAFDNGERVRLRGKLSLYEARGSYQLIARVALPAGMGDLGAQFEALRRKLHAEGLFDPERKRPLPQLPRTVGVVTSSRGAALHDVVRVAGGRLPVHIVVADCRVQGADAPGSIVRALQDIQRLDELDVVILTRGGGSAEDLVAFNDERLARTLAACRVPTVSGVGHEVDITIADLVADVRASTPSNAAELVVPDREALASELAHLERRVERALDHRLHRARLQLERVRREIRDPRHRIAAFAREFETTQRRAQIACTEPLRRRRRALSELTKRLEQHDSRARVRDGRAELHQLSQRLRRRAHQRTQAPRNQLVALEGRLAAAGPRIHAAPRTPLEALAARLDAMSPLKVLGRGYAIAFQEPSGRVLRRATDAQPGDKLRLRLGEGELHARVQSATSNEES